MGRLGTDWAQAQDWARARVDWARAGWARSDCVQTSQVPTNS
jgi:hypothetical protein